MLTQINRDRKVNGVNERSINIFDGKEVSVE